MNKQESWSTERPLWDMVFLVCSLIIYSSSSIISWIIFRGAALTVSSPSSSIEALLLLLLPLCSPSILEILWNWTWTTAFGARLKSWHETVTMSLSAACWKMGEWVFLQASIWNGFVDLSLEVAFCLLGHPFGMLCFCGGMALPFLFLTLGCFQIASAALSPTLRSPCC